MNTLIRRMRWREVNRRFEALAPKPEHPELSIDPVTVILGKMTRGLSDVGLGAEKG